MKERRILYSPRMEKDSPLFREIDRDSVFNIENCIISMDIIARELKKIKQQAWRTYRDSSFKDTREKTQNFELSINQIEEDVLKSTKDLRGYIHSEIEISYEIEHVTEDGGFFCYLTVPNESFCKLHYIIDMIQREMDYQLDYLEHPDDNRIWEARISVFLFKDIQKIAELVSFYSSIYETKMKRLMTIFDWQKVFDIDWNRIHWLKCSPEWGYRIKSVYPDEYGIQYFIDVLNNIWNHYIDIHQSLTSETFSGSYYQHYEEVQRLALSDPNQLIEMLHKDFLNIDKLDVLLKVLAGFYYETRERQTEELDNIGRNPRTITEI